MTTTAAKRLSKLCGNVNLAESKPYFQQEKPTMRTFTVEESTEFAERQGGDGLRIGDSNQFIFSNGAAFLSEDGSVRSEPPTDPLELLRRQRAYWREAAKRAEQAFNETKRAFLDRCALLLRYNSSSAPPPPKDAPRILADMANKVDECRKKLADIEKQVTTAVDATDEGKAIAYARERDAQDKTVISNMQHHLSLIAIGGNYPPEQTNKPAQVRSLI
jgi:hypothetical protein